MRTRGSAGNGGRQGKEGGECTSVIKRLVAVVMTPRDIVVVGKLCEEDNQRKQRGGSPSSRTLLARNDPQEGP